MPYIGLTLVVVIALLGLFTALRRLEVRRAEEARARFRERGIVRLASRVSFFGVSSRGVGQMRGSGVLLATRDAVAFELWVPRRLVEIPARDILRVEQVKSHLGRTVGRPLLKITWRRRDIDGMDSAAWLVEDPTGWARSIEALR